MAGFSWVWWKLTATSFSRYKIILDVFYVFLSSFATTSQKDRSSSMHLFLLADWKTFKGIWRFQWSKLSRELPGFQTAASNEPNGNILRTAIPAFSALGGNSQPWKSKCEPFNSQNLAKATFQTCRGNWWNWHGEARFMKGFPRMAYFNPGFISKFLFSESGILV